MFVLIMEATQTLSRVSELAAVEGLDDLKIFVQGREEL